MGLKVLLYVILTKPSGLSHVAALCTWASYKSHKTITRLQTYNLT